MKNLATKVAAVATSMSLLLTSASAAATIYPDASRNGTDGARLTLSDAAGDLAPAYLDLPQRSGDERVYEMGNVYVYGNAKKDDSGENSYDDLAVAFNNTPSTYGVVYKNSSNTNNVVYDMVYSNGTNVYDYTETDKVPGTSVSSLKKFLEDAATKGVATNTSSTTTAFDDDYNLVQAIGASQVQKGDPDVMTDYMDEVWVYVNNGSEEYAWHMNLQLSKTLQDKETAKVASTKVVARGVVGRVDITPGNLDGVVGYELEVSGDATFDYVTQYPVVFFPLSVNDNIDTTVYTLNAQGDQDNDGLDNNNYDADYVEIKKELSDVEGSVFYDNIQYLYKLGVVDGLSSGKFGVNDSVTRGQLSKFVVNTFGLPFNLSGTWFSDVKATDTFGAYIQSLKNAGVVNGFSDGTYRANDVVTRGQATKYIFNAATYFDENAIDTSSCTFKDSASFGVFAGYICGLSEFGDDYVQKIISGYSDGNFGPNDPLTRGQMAKIMLNAGSLIEKTAGHPFLGDGLGLRAFVAPVAVENFDDSATTASSVTLEWDDLQADDTSVDAYILERREVGDTTWDQVGPDDGLFAAPVATYTDNTVNDDTRYEYRIAAMKWVEADYAEDAFVNTIPGADTNNREFMLIGPWTVATARTPQA